jgi:hypothetical protein
MILFFGMGQSAAFLLFIAGKGSVESQILFMASLLIGVAGALLFLSAAVKALFTTPLQK